MSRRLVTTVLASTAVLAATLTVPLVASPASAAAPTATAMVKTQRMTAATLNSTQAGWYEKGARLQLTCYVRGQAVQGYFSPYIGNGGWDNLWYKVSDGYFVADVDIETRSNNPVTGACPTAPAPQPPAPAPSSSIMTRAKTWLDAGVRYNMRGTYKNQYGTYRTDCSGYVSMAWGLSSSYVTGTLPQVAYRINKADLKAGDILLNTAAGGAGHAAIFVRWANAEKTRYVSWEQNGAAGKTIQQTIPYPYLPGNGTFLPYRKRG